MNLIIVESPTKARTISQFLGNDFTIESCSGHVRDLPKSKMGIDIEHDFEPQYIIPVKKRKVVNNLKKIAPKFKTIYFATDEDREGEAIAWHLTQLLKSTDSKLEKQIKRIAFHEITKEAIKEALENPRKIDLSLVDAQQARRILDRLVGYELSPFLWRKIARRLSAGRVQSPALRLIVEREREIEKFVPEEYWRIEAELRSQINADKTQINADDKTFLAELYKINEKKLAKLAIKSKLEVNEILKDLKNAKYIVIKIEKKEVKRCPLPPFTTSTLQQDANKKFGFSTKQTMFIAQQLYEGIELGDQGSAGLITYMRTDSFNLADKFLSETKKFIKNEFGDNYGLPEFRRFKTKSKLAQEAHEAIRPTSIERVPEKIKSFLDKNQFKLYDLIWRRALASQMKEAEFVSETVDIKTKQDISKNVYTFRANGLLIKFDGFLKIWSTKSEEAVLPPLKINEELRLIKLQPGQHFTEPPARYSEAGLVKTLEKYGIGRPSTYAPIISTIQERNYIQKENGRLKPTEIGFLVNDLLVNHFPKIVDYQFTAKMENNLDEIAAGQEKWLPMIKNFYQPFKELIKQKEKEISKEDLSQEKTDEICEKCGQPMLVKMSRFGKFLACSGFPKCRFTKSLNNQGIKLENKIGVKCPKCQAGEIVKKRTKKGRFFYGCNQWPKCDFALWQKPTGGKCPKCGSLMVEIGKKIKCSNKDCNHGDRLT